MSSRRELANAIRALSMDAVQKANPVTRVHQWVWRYRRGAVERFSEAQPDQPNVV